MTVDRREKLEEPPILQVKEAYQSPYLLKLTEHRTRYKNVC